MKYWWWKILGILLVLASTFLALSAPLSPGIVGTAPNYLSSGENRISLTGYNTRFAEGTAPAVFITDGSSFFCGENVQALQDDSLAATIELPDTVSSNFFDLYVIDHRSDTIFLASAFTASGMDVIAGARYSRDCPSPESSEEVAPFDFPNQPILTETIRNLFFHVPAWFAMMVIMFVSVFQSVRHLGSGSLNADSDAREAAHVGIWLGIIGLATGSLWAKFTWGAWWVSDPRLNGAAITELIYLAYFVLRGSITDREKAARIAAVYNIFAFVMLILFIMVLPRMTDSLHPGVGGNPAFSQYDLDSNMRWVFYPAVIGWILIAAWIWQLRARLSRIKNEVDYA